MKKAKRNIASGVKVVYGILYTVLALVGIGGVTAAVLVFTKILGV